MRIKMVAFAFVLLLILPAQAFASSRTYADLSADLKILKSTPWVKSFVAGKFDCSNMSALLDFYLDELGHDSWIFPGTVFHYNPETKQSLPVINHVMLMVFTTDKGAWWVESTLLTVSPVNSLAVKLGSGDLFVPHLVFPTVDHAPWYLKKELSWSEQDAKRILEALTD